MELELGLAPPSARHHIPMATDHGHHLAAADELSSTSSDQHPCAARAGKRQFAEAFQAATTLPLFDDGSSSCGGRSSVSKRPLVGWPPVSSARSRACGGVGVGAKYVKVKKEGDAIGRKVDLSLHASYDELLATLARMFPTTTGNQGRYHCSLSVYDKKFRIQGICNHPIQPTDSDDLIPPNYCHGVAADKEISSTSTSHVDVVVTYEDGEGDWMLVGDVPWE